MKLERSSWNDLELKANLSLALDYITTPPKMALYSKYSTEIYNVYLKYFSVEDIHDYSIDEVFIDATDYIKARKITAHDLVRTVFYIVLTCFNHNKQQTLLTINTNKDQRSIHYKRF